MQGSTKLNWISESAPRNAEILLSLLIQYLPVRMTLPLLTEMISAVFRTVLAIHLLSLPALTEFESVA